MELPVYSIVGVQQYMPVAECLSLFFFRSFRLRGHVLFASFSVLKHIASSNIDVRPSTPLAFVVSMPKHLGF